MISNNASVFDASGLATLRTEAARNGDEALDHAAREFESLFLRMLLKTMRDSMPQSGLTGSSHVREYQDMHDTQLSAQLARTGGIGLADVIARQLKPPTSVGRPPEPLAIDQYRRVQAHSQPLLPAEQAFVDRIRPHAEAAAQRLGTSAETLIAQSALETGWGRSLPQESQGATSHNYFGIKAGGAWEGETVRVSTVEYQGDLRKQIHAGFRAYNDVASSFRDYADLIGRSSRYSSARGKSGRPYFNALVRGGYATDPHYADKATRVFERLKSSGEVPITPHAQTRLAVASTAYEVRQ